MRKKKTGIKNREGSAPARSRWYWYAADAASDPGQAAQSSEAQKVSAGFKQRLI